MGICAPQVAARAAAANWKPSSSASTRSSSTTEKGAPPSAACAHSSWASLPERVVRAERPASAAMDESSREALCSSSTMRMVGGKSAHLEVVGKGGADRARLAEKLEGAQRAPGHGQGREAGRRGEVLQIDLGVDLVLEIDARFLYESGVHLRRPDGVLEAAQVIDQPALQRLRAGPDAALRHGVDLIL